jgi:hypothetical protein
MLKTHALEAPIIFKMTSLSNSTECTNCFEFVSLFLLTVVNSP